MKNSKNLKFVDLYNENRIFLGCSLQTSPATIYNIHRDPDKEGRRLDKLLLNKDYSDTKEGWYLTSIDFGERNPTIDINSFFLATDIDLAKGVMVGLLCISGLPMASSSAINKAIQGNFNATY